MVLAICAINKERSSRESIARKVQFSREQTWISRTARKKSGKKVEKRKASRNMFWYNLTFKIP